MAAHDDLLKSISRAVSEEQARLRWLVMSVVSGAIKLSETELMEASREVIGLQHDARQNADSLRGVAQLVGKEGELVAQVFGYPSRFSEEAILRLRQQVEVTERAMNLTDQIGGFVGEIGKISNAVRVLTINGYIESTRLGGEGRAFAVIAEQLQELGEKVRSANEGIRDLTSSLGKLIPQIGDSARQLLRNTEQLENEHTDAMFMFQGASSAAQRDMTGALGEAQERAQRIATRASQVLSHLQFQDRMAQQLRELEQMAADTEKTLAGMFDKMSVGRDDADDALQTARMQGSRRPVRPGPPPEQTVHGGDTLLFD